MLLCAVATGVDGPRVRRDRAVLPRRRARRSRRSPASSPSRCAGPRVDGAPLGPARGAHRRRRRPRRRRRASGRRAVRLAPELRARSSRSATDRTARMAVTPMRGGREKQRRLPRAHRAARGAARSVRCSPCAHDLLGLARSISGSPASTRSSSPRGRSSCAMPELGDGILGRHLLAQSVRLGPGEFHSLREYVPGDEPRTIHWRASARSDELKVRQHSRRGAAPLHGRARPAGADGRRPRRGVRAGRRRGGQPRAQRRPGGSADPLRHHRRRRPARPDGVGAHDAPPRPGDARPAPAAADRARPGRGPRPRVRHHADARASTRS